MLCRLLGRVLAVTFLLASVCLAQATPSTQTLVFIRHGEKPDSGLGQLNCQGLNRALRLPSVFAKQFDKPAAIFAPNPAFGKDDQGEEYAYIRPLATIEPTAIELGLPVNVDIGFDDIEKLQGRLEASAFANATVFVAWEHKQIIKLVKHLLKANKGGDIDVPKWNGTDFDSIYVVRITRDGEKVKSSFEIRHQNLNDLPKTCPN